MNRSLKIFINTCMNRPDEYVPQHLYYELQPNKTSLHILSLFYPISDYMNNDWWPALRIKLFPRSVHYWSVWISCVNVCQVGPLICSNFKNIATILSIPSPFVQKFTLNYCYYLTKGACFKNYFIFFFSKSSSQKNKWCVWKNINF